VNEESTTEYENTYFDSQIKKNYRFSQSIGSSPYKKKTLKHMTIANDERVDEI
jgi:hypothetical protein